MGSTLTTIDAILKTQYLPLLREQLNNNIVLLSRIEKNSEMVVGKNFTVAHHFGRNEGVVMRAESGTLPTAGNQQYKESITSLKYLYGKISLTGQAIKASKNNEGAYVKALESEMKGLMTDVKTDLNRQLYGDGTGQLTVCGTTSAATTVVVVSTAKLRVGMVVDIVVSATGATSTGALAATILTIPTSTSFTIAATVTTDSSFSVYVNGNRNKEVMGLSGICSATSTLQGLDVATYPWFKATVLSNSSVNRALTEILLQTGIDTVKQAGNGEVTALYTSFGVRRAYQALLQAQKSFVNTMEFKGGVKALDYNGMPMIADKDCPANTIFGVDESDISLYDMGDFDFMDMDGAILARTSIDAYEATLYRYLEIGIGARNKHLKIADITEA